MDKDTMIKNMKIYALHSRNINNSVIEIEGKLNKVLDKNVSDLNINLYPIIQNEIMSIVHSRKFIFSFVNRYNSAKDLLKQNNVTENEEKVKILMNFFKKEKTLLREQLNKNVIEKVKKDINFHLFYLNDIKSSCNRMPPKTIATSIKMKSRNNNHMLIGDKDCDILGIPLDKNCDNVGFAPSDIERPPYLSKHDFVACDLKKDSIETAEETERQRLAKLKPTTISPSSNVTTISPSSNVTTISPEPIYASTTFEPIYASTTSDPNNEEQYEIITPGQDNLLIL